MIFISVNVIGQITSASYKTNFTKTPSIDASVYKLNGVTKEFSQWATSGSNISYSAGNVGIKKSPSYELDVNGTINATNLYKNGVIFSYNTMFTGSPSIDNIVNTQSLLYFRAGTSLRWAIGKTSDTESGSNNGADFALYRFADNGTDLPKVFTVKRNNGFIGINNNSPTYQLDVSGIVSTTSYLIQQGIYAGIYVADGATAQSIANGATYTKSTAFVTNGLSANCTPDVANDKITITKTGKYMVIGTCSFTSGTNSVVWKSAAFLDGVEQGNIHWARKVGTGSDVGSASFMGIINVTSVPVDLDVRFRHDQAGSINITVVYSNITVNYIGE